MKDLTVEMEEKVVNSKFDKNAEGVGQSIKPRWRISALIAAVGLIITAILSYGFYTGDRISRVYAPLVDSTMEIKLEASLGHLWFEEIMTGDRSEEMGTVWKHLDQADWYAKAMLEGGENPEGIFISLDNNEMRREIREVREKLVTFADITKKRLAAKEGSGIGTPIDQHYDKVFRDFFNQADQVETALQKMMTEDRNRFRYSQVILIAISLLLFLSILIAFSRFDHRRIQDLISLREINKNLELEIIERKKAEEALRKSETLLTATQQLAKVGGWEFDVKSQTMFWTEETYRIHDFQRYEVDPSSPDYIELSLKCYDPEARPTILGAFRRCIEKGQAYDLEFPFTTAIGHRKWIRTVAEPVLEGDRIVKVIGNIMDITVHKLAKDALRESEEKYREFVEGTDDLVTRVDFEGRLIYANHMAEKILGVSMDNCIGISAFDFIHSDDKERTASAFAGWIRDQKRSITFENRQVNQTTGDVRHMLWTINLHYDENWEITGINSVGRDLTNYKKMEGEILKAKKLESVGVLAGGIAHDFNNLLTSVVGYISLARIDMKPGSKTFQNLVKAEKVSIQTKELTARLITFSEGGGPVKEIVSIGNLIKNSVDSSLKGSDINAGFSIPDDISPVEVDEDQMKQAIHNIITNAREAMAGQGTINVSCENVNIGEKDPLTLKNGKYVKISIEDQGPGIPDENLGKIFDPYFSTKDMGTQKGVGLGLAVSDSIVKKHNGLITVESELGTGTIFSIYLPASEKEIEEAAPVKKPAPEISVIQGEKILVMDDEEVVRDVFNALLTHLGCEVEVAEDGVEAIGLYKKAMESEKPFDMVILDLTNKVGMGGAETIVRLLEIDPDVKAIVASGYSNDPIISNFREHGFRGALPKPFNFDQLKTALQDAIAGK